MQVKAPATSGELPLTKGYVFQWMLDGKGTELFGWTHRPDGSYMSGESGWFRTTNPTEAAKVAQSNLEYNLVCGKV